MVRRRHSTDSRQYDEWLECSGEDLMAANVLRQDDRCYAAAAFHCQQSVEKALKAYILLESGQLCDGHNLVWLCKRAMRYDRRFSDWLDESARLSGCYIETRYPSDDAPEYTYRRVREAYHMARDMFRFIFSQVDAHFEETDEAEETEETEKAGKAE